MPTIDRHLTPDDLAATMREDVRRGLTASPKVLAPKYFYDGRGSELFEEITRLPEYYPTRAEREILQTRAGEIADLTKARTLVELGSGSSEKTHLLLGALRDVGSLERYVPVDVSVDAIEWAMPGLVEAYPGVEVHGVVADFERHLHLLPTEGPRLVAFLGGTVGNFEPDQRAAFLAAVAATMTPGDALLLGTDLVKDPARLVAAYDDAAGVTADFDLNVLRVMNASLGADFDVDGFEHLSVWNAEDEWIEMRLRSRRAQRVRLAALDLEVDFAEGEQVRTEISAKFRQAKVEAELEAAGLRPTAFWTDEAGDYALSLGTA
ncbi:L-histidine N(alpha)-methyltransferase [Nocardioides sp. AX2bis]|uniref:L-histidine N(alpha)-methyltransferase n=1 Tax=Nocardioides sp. AX2bis TaxID=2653157 RepID=UPI0012F30F3F|nr:L-histidine N(alpha)-methyltransferase [Nocardioides sp. AX2bis]VXB24472.1 Histidine N-alpha-methyltransferase [Nocardioides sp. AX2bis]